MHRPKQPAEDERKHHLSHLVQSTYKRPTNTEQYVPKRSVNCPTTVCDSGVMDVKKKTPHPRKLSWSESHPMDILEPRMQVHQRRRWLGVCSKLDDEVVRLHWSRTTKIAEWRSATDRALAKKLFRTPHS